MKLLFKFGHLLLDQAGDEIARAVKCANGSYSFRLKSQCRWHGGYRSMDDALSAAAESMRLHVAPPEKKHQLSPFVYADYFMGRPDHVQTEAYKCLMAIDPSVECGGGIMQ